MIFLLISSFFYRFFQTYFVFFGVGGLFLACLLTTGSARVCCLNSPYLYIDRIGSLLFGLTYVIIVVLYFINYNNKCFYLFFNFIVIFLSLGLCLFSYNFLVIYLFFELSIIPLVFIIVYRGGNEERFEACVYLLLYTIFSSLLFLVLLVFIRTRNFYFFEINLRLFNSGKGVLWLIMYFVFLVKMPLYSVHRWLRKAHVEAPVEGSMLLAGVLLKLGCFGAYRLVNFISFNFCKTYVDFVLAFSVAGSFIACLICMRQTDIKSLIAYSSVRHIGLLLAGLIRFLVIGWSGGLGIMLAHGFCSRAIFFIANIFYTRTGSRNILTMKGISTYFPVTVYCWLFFCMLNMGTPPSINFFSEIILLVSVVKKRLIIGVVVCMYLMSVVYYSLILFLRAGHGHSWVFNHIKKESFIEILVIFFHIIISLVFILAPNIFFHIS